MNCNLGDSVYVYTGRGWRLGVIEAVGPSCCWVLYGVGKASRRVRVSDPRMLRDAKEKRPKAPPVASREQLTLGL